MEKYADLKLVATCLAISFSVTCAAAKINVDTIGHPGDFRLIADGAATTIVIDANDAQVVATMANALASDLEAVTGIRPEVSDHISNESTPVIAGTIGRSPIIDRLIEKGKINVEGVKDQWEAYGLQIVDTPFDGIEKALVCFGQNSRSTAYALMEISRLCGVSPFIWWADVKPLHKDALYVDGDRTVIESPSVKYRGIFINDED